MKFSIPFRETAKRKAYEASRLPSTWPSHMHNKCNVPTCHYPNAPQVADGTFNCLGSCCEGTYYVSPSTASSVMKNSKSRMAREDKARWNAKKIAEFQRQKVVKAQLDEEARRMAAEELAAKYDEKRRLKNAVTGSTAVDLSSSTYLVRKTAQRRSPANTKPTNTTTEQHHASSIQNQVHHAPAVSHYCQPPVDLNRSGRMPLQTSSFSQGFRTTNKYLPEYNSSQFRHTETLTYNYQNGRSPSWF